MKKDKKINLNQLFLNFYKWDYLKINENYLSIFITFYLHK
jgi:hypothetical protein